MTYIKKNLVLQEKLECQKNNSETWHVINYHVNQYFLSKIHKENKKGKSVNSVGINYWST